MTSKEINRKNLTAFVCRALNRAGASAVDLEFGTIYTWKSLRPLSRRQGCRCSRPSRT